MTTVLDLPGWVRAKLGFDRVVSPDPGTDEYLKEVRTLYAEGEFADLFAFVPVSTTRSSIELLVERRSNQAVLLCDTDCLDRLDGLLALVLADDGQSPEAYHRLGVIALADLLAGMFIVSDPAISMEIMTLRAAFDPDDVSVIVEDDAQLDRMRRLIRVYLFHHELGHLMYATGEHVFPEVGEMIEDALRHFSLARGPQAPVDRSPSAQRLIERGLTIPYEEIPAFEAEIREQLAHPGTREETWCDAFAIRRMLDWAVAQGIPVEECYAVDVLLHLFVGARLQWFGFWSPRTSELAWDELAMLKQHQTRAHVRSLIFVPEAFHAWRRTQDGDGQTGSLFGRLEDSRDALTDPLIERFYERFDFALGLLQHHDREEMHERARVAWAGLDASARARTLSDILYDLSHIDE